LFIIASIPLKIKRFIQMKRIRFRFLTLLMLGFGISTVGAQSGTVSSGGDASGSGGSVSYSVGQVLFTPNYGETGTVLHGMQQPYEIYTVGVEDLAWDLSMSVFPNPTFSRLILEVTDHNTEGMHYQLFSAEGRLIEDRDLDGPRTRIDMQSGLAGTYYLVVTLEQKPIKTFKIIKNN
jgi:hypothetical protein